MSPLRTILQSTRARDYIVTLEICPRTEKFFFIIFYISAFLDSRNQEESIEKRPNILENLAQTVAGTPIELYNSPIRKTLMRIGEYSFQAA